MRPLDVLIASSSLSPATGPLVAAALLLASAGVAKLRRPAPTGLALARAGLPGGDPAVRALGAIEVVAALLAVAVGGVTALAVSVLYLGFAGFTLLQVIRARSPHEAAADCGCFGDDSAPVGPEHVAVNLFLAAAAAWGATSGGLVDGLGAEPVAAVAVAALAALAASGLRAVLTDLAAVRALISPPEAAT